MFGFSRKDKKPPCPSRYMGRQDDGKFHIALKEKNLQLRGENDPEWTKHLCKNVKSDFAKSYRYLESV